MKIPTHSVLSLTTMLLFATFRADANPPQIPTPAVSVAAAARECGLSPEAIVVADAQQSVPTIVSHLESAVVLRELLANTRSALDVAALSLEAAGRELAAAPTDETLQSAYAETMAELASARAALQQTRDAIFTLATDQLPTQAREVLVTWRIASSFSVPAEFRVLDRTTEQWHSIEGALRAEQRAERLGQPFVGAQAILLAGIRADIEVIAAEMRVAQHLAEVEAAIAN